jgi:regulator of sigma E protease
MQILAGVLLLGVLITFHELGHFLFAKWLGVRVLVFSVGFGPKLIGFKRGDTEYRLSAIPLGGYVKMFGESLDDEMSPEEKKISFMHQAIWRKSLIAVAGPLFNFILPVILFFALLVGHEQVFAPRVGTLLPDGVAAKSGMHVDDLVVAVNGHAVLSFNEVADTIAHNPDVDVSLRIKRKTSGGSFEELDLVVRPERKFSSNPLEKDQPVGRIGIMPAIEQPIVVVSNHSPLAQGLKNFDEVITIDGRHIDSAAALMSALHDLKPGSRLIVKRKRPGQEALENITIEAPTDLNMPMPSTSVQLSHNLADGDFPNEIVTQIDSAKEIIKKERDLVVASHGVAPAKGVITEIKAGSVVDSLGLGLGDRIISIDGEGMASAQLPQIILQNPFATHVMGAIKADGTPVVAVFSLPKSATDKLSLDGDLLTVVGFSTMQVFKAGELIERSVGVGEALKRASLQTADIALMTGKSLLMLVKNEAPASQLGGPIMLFDIAQKAAQKGVAYYIFIMCLLSVNLGLLNLLPIPALDGGHLLLFGIEAVQRKPLTAKTRAIATQIGVTFLLLVMALALFNDLARLLR